MSRKQGPREAGMRPAAIGAGRRPLGIVFDENVSEAAT
jgi:hypothetical protein